MFYFKFEMIQFFFVEIFIKKRKYQDIANITKHDQIPGSKKIEKLSRDVKHVRRSPWVDSFCGGGYFDFP